MAVGLVHFLPDGGIVEVCGNDLNPLYEKPFRPSGSDKALGTVAFFGLVRAGDELVAAGIDGLYRFDKTGLTGISPMPQFKAVGEFQISFDDPRFIVVVNEIYRRKSVSGGAPLMVSRDAR